jgi:protein N-terminal methyltransferase
MSSAGAGAGRAAESESAADEGLASALPVSRVPHAHAELHARQAECAEAIALEIASVGAPAGGEDTRGTRFASVAALWRAKANPRAARSWYQLGADYWAGIPQDLDGVLGGQTHIDGVDVAESAAFLADRVQAARGVGARRALDLGAGIGRVTRALLAGRFDVVDLVEQDEAMLAQAVRELSAALPPGRLGRALVAGLQDLDFAELGGGAPGGGAPGGGAPPRYDCVWLQWVVGCVLDVDYVALLRACGAHLAPGGCVVVKDNCAADASAFVYDATDHSVARGRAYHEACFRLAGLRVVEEDHQRTWDKDLMTVRMWMLRPLSWGDGAGT